jgi:GPH family glycoside/pentoside/hexuronide:cation symporter
MFFGMNGFVIRFAFTIQGIITGTVLTLTGYVAASDAVLFPEQPASALLGLRLMIGGIPAIASILAFIILSGYRLHGSKLEAMRREVAALHARKEAGV